MHSKPLNRMDSAGNMGLRKKSENVVGAPKYWAAQQSFEVHHSAGTKEKSSPNMTRNVVSTAGTPEPSQARDRQNTASRATVTKNVGTKRTIRSRTSRSAQRLNMAV